MKQTQEALKWIVRILRSNRIPFQIDGGFAARVYGSERELADIDIDVPKGSISIIHNLVKPYVIYGPKRYKDRNWDIYLMTLKYKGQEIDIYPQNCKIFDKNINHWVTLNLNAENSEYRKIYGLRLPFIAKHRLIEYKSKLRRRVDLRDVANLTIG